MSLLETSQIIFNILGSLAFIAFSVVVIVIGMAVFKAVTAVRKGVETVKEKSALIESRIKQAFAEISFVHVAAKMASWFKNKKKK